MVVAGLHVGILAYLLFLALRTGFVPRRAALVAVAAVTGLYALVTDAQPPVIRAMILVWIVCGSMWYARPRLALNSLALAGLVVLVWNPTDLFRTGAQLSFLAVAGLILFADREYRRMTTNPELQSTAHDPLEALIARSQPWPTRAIHRFGEEVRRTTLAGLVIWLVGVPMREIAVGNTLASGDDSRISILHPPPDGMGATENADSILLAVDWHGRRFLTTGDLAPPGLETVVAEPTRPFDVAMVPHHGSATSLPSMFAGWCHAHWAVISGDISHDSHVAVNAYKAAGSIVLNTATSGAVHFAMQPTGDAIRVDCFRNGDRW